ncbi:hypothetical protein [Enterovibrio norvegicus]|uniref:hypothetical protein n=1 Tax=Enterovibrio norvegicus TaxID=188144 RepID=UPI0024B078D7|nr:hypothetical protein [Enterovibrio norvegicus]
MNVRKAVFFIFILFFVGGCRTTPAAQLYSGLPSPPHGFSWYESVNGVGSFLKPDGWFVKEESSGQTNAVFISKENIEASARFLTGMTVNQMNSWSDSNSSKPSQYAHEFAKKIASSGEVLINTVIKGNQNDMHVVRLLSNNSGKATIVHYLAIGMDSRDQLYLIIYESPEPEWGANENNAREMLNLFFLGE